MHVVGTRREYAERYGKLDGKDDISMYEMQGKKIEVHPLKPENWENFVSLFGEHGAYEGCWCMWWRIPEKEFEEQLGDGNKNAMKELVQTGTIPGILAYVEEQPAAWCSLGPRSNFPQLHNSNLLLEKAEDNEVWAIVCFFIGESFRRKGLMVPLIRAATEYAISQGAKIVEAYPIDPTEDLSGCKGYTGIGSSFITAGYKEIFRDKGQLITRYCT